MNEYALELALLKEYEHVVRLKRVYGDLVQEFSGLIQESLEFCETHGLPLKERDKIHRLMKRAIEFDNYRHMVLTDESKHLKDSDGEVTEPDLSPLFSIMEQISSKCFIPSSSSLAELCLAMKSKDLI